MDAPRQVEVCVDSVDGAVAAERAGARRIELCAALLEGGLTPSAGMIEVVRRRVTLDVHVMIRPRGGDFLYAPTELEAMGRDIDTAKRLGADGVVFGVLTPEGDVDVPRTRELTTRARPMRVTFHRAFDMARDPIESLETLVALGIERILSSGQEASALEGVDLLRELVARGAGRITVMPGGGVHEGTIARVLEHSGAREIHVAAMREAQSRMRFRNTRCFMGGELRPPEFSTAVADVDRIGTLVRLAAGPDGPPAPAS